MTREERLEKQKQRLIEMKVPEEDLHEQGYRCIAGIDEVGRGPLAGPVVAAAVVLPEEFSVLGIDDSKKLSEKRREELFVEIKKHAVAWGIGMADHQVIDEINILQATKLAMRRAVHDLEQKLADAGKDPLDYLLFDAVKIEELGSAAAVHHKRGCQGAGHCSRIYHSQGHKRQNDGEIRGSLSGICL